MSARIRTNGVGAISAKELSTSIARFEEGDNNLRKLHEFEDSGGKIRWVVDTDVVHLGTNNRDGARARMVAHQRARSDQSLARRS